MKRLLILFIFLVVGIVLGSSYYVWKSNQTNSDIEHAKKEPRFSIEQAPRNSEVGTVQSMIGTIRWVSRVTTATEGAQITQPIPIQQGEDLITGPDGNVVISYQSGLTISLSPNSHLAFVQMLPANFVVNQLNGTIEYQKNSPIPLGIRSLHLLAQVDNGEAQIITDEKKGSVEITVKRGSVRLAFNDLKNISNVVSLSQGERYLFDDEKRMGNIVTGH